MVGPLPPKRKKMQRPLRLVQVNVRLHKNGKKCRVFNLGGVFVALVA